MKKRRRLVSPIGCGSSRPVVPDRRSTDLPRNAQVAPVVVDDPYGLDTGETILVYRSLRDDPLAALRARHQVDEAEYLAGRHWQHAFEIAQLGGSKAINPMNEAVDGGSIPEGLSDRQARAFDDLKRASRALGPEGESIVKDVLGRGMPIVHVGTARGMTSARELLYFGRRFRECLNTLAVTFGYAMR
jgi:hypothetical protein